MAMKVRYTVVNGQVLSENRNGVERDYIPDSQGNTIALMDSTGALTDTFSYFPSGAIASRTGTTPAPFQNGGGYGYYRDTPKRNYVRARNFYVNLGRWSTPDPIGFNGGDFNLYRYVNNRFVTLSDPSGLYPECGTAAAIGSICCVNPNGMTTCSPPGLGPVTGKPSPELSRICGTRIDGYLARALEATKIRFNKLPWYKKFYACSSIIGISTWKNAWDIIDLHGNQARFDSYSEKDHCMCCAECGYIDKANAKNNIVTVEVDENCFYPGSVNYALFGVISDLCCTVTGSWIIGLPIKSLCLGDAKRLVSLYKRDSSNYQASLDWTVAGFNGWHNAPTPNSERPKCKPKCDEPMRGPEFEVHWEGLGENFWW